MAEHLISRAAFLAWHRSLAASLQRHWRAVEGRELSVAHKYKLIDLLVKWLSQYDFGSQRVTDGLMDYANCALDDSFLFTLVNIGDHSIYRKR